MKTNLFRITRLIAVLILCLNINSCKVAYKSIHYTKVDGDMVKKTKDNSQTKMKENVTFVHAGDSVYQLINVKYKGLDTDKQTITGERIDVDTLYTRAYDLLKLRTRATLNEVKIAGPRAKYFKQTHIFVDSIELSNNFLEIKEQRIEQIRSYYQSKTTRYILFGVFALLFGLVMLVVVSLQDLDIGGTGI